MRNNHHNWIFSCKQTILMGNVSKVPVNGFKWKKNMSKFNEEFLKNYNEKSTKNILEVDVE